MPTRLVKPPMEPKCPKCAGSMEPGNILERAPHSVGMKSRWVKGHVEQKALKTSYGTRMVVTWRCKECGLLESYAK